MLPTVVSRFPALGFRVARVGGGGGGGWVSCSPAMDFSCSRRWFQKLSCSYQVLNRLDT
jgi:hypothetical protein